jgi:hypothetical protein
MVKKIKKYSYNAKIRLRDRVECLPKKSQFIKVYNIITPKSYTENNNGILIYFHNLSNETYRDLEIFLDDVDDNDIESTERRYYKPYAKDEFPQQEKLNPKLRYSNREKSLMRKHKYESTQEDERSEYVCYTHKKKKIKQTLAKSSK